MCYYVVMPSFGLEALHKTQFFCQEGSKIFGRYLKTQKNNIEPQQFYHRIIRSILGVQI